MKLEEITLFSHLVARPESELDLVRVVLLIAEPEYLHGLGNFRD